MDYIATILNMGIAQSVVLAFVAYFLHRSGTLAAIFHGIRNKDESFLTKGDAEEYIVKATQSGKSETSGLVMELKSDMVWIKDHMKSNTEKLDAIDNHLKELNGKTNKHAIAIAVLEEQNKHK